MKPVFVAEEIFKPNPKCPSSHASTIVELANKDLLVAWYAGSYEKAADVAILCSWLPYGNNAWTESVVLADTPGKSGGNPVLFVMLRVRCGYFMLPCMVVVGIRAR